MGARLHRHVERRPTGALARGSERHDLAVSATVSLRHALADDGAGSDNDRTDRRIGVGHPRRGPGELERAVEAHAAAAAMRT